jgi:hypothetical protein
MPDKFDEGVLYVSKEFGIAGHLCACGCENKVFTPIDVTEWDIKINNGKVSMWPSIGNGQLPCKSHYLILNDNIIWLNNINYQQYLRNLNSAHEARKKYYKEMDNNKSIFSNIKIFLKKLFKLFKK